MRLPLSCAHDIRLQGNTRLSLTLLSPEEFLAFQQPWNLLLANSLSDNFFLRHEWLAGWWTVFHPGKTLLVLTVTEDSALIGIAPLYLERTYTPTPSRVIKFCGADDLRTDYHDFIAARGREALVARAVFSFLERFRHIWDVVILDSLRENALALTDHAYRSGPWRVTFAASAVCPYISLGDSYEGYLRTRFDRKKRYNLGRQCRIVLQERGVTQYRVSQPADIPSALDLLFALHAKRSEAKRIRSAFSTPSAMRFHRQIAPKLHTDGFLDLRFLQSQRSAVSGTYSFIYGKKLYLYQTGMDPDWSRDSVGTVLLTLLVKDCFSQGLCELDFLRGDEGYKLAWATGVRKEFVLSMYNHNSLGRLAYAAHVVKRQAKQLLRPSPTDSPNTCTRRNGPE